MILHVIVGKICLLDDSLGRRVFMDTGRSNLNQHETTYYYSSYNSLLTIPFFISNIHQNKDSKREGEI